MLLHALGCTGLLTWFPSIRPLSKRFRVVTLDLRWHGQGIRSEEFSLADCADDVAALIDLLELEDVIVAGYSMGSIVAQRVWRQHPEKVSGLVLGATTDRFQLSLAERAFFTGMGTSMLATRGISRSRTALRAARVAHDRLDLDPTDMHEWALREFRSTSPWAVGQALAALGRHHSRPWIGRIDVPTAVVVNTKDKVIPAERQVRLARSIPGATIHEVKAGHASCVLNAERFVPAHARGGADGQRTPAGLLPPQPSRLISGPRRPSEAARARPGSAAPARHRPGPTRGRRWRRRGPCRRSTSP